MEILSWIIFGLIAGIIAKALHPGKDPGGWIITIAIGIAGAFLGGWIGSMIGWREPNNFSVRSFILAVVGSLILLGVYSIATRKKSSGS
ncbi:MAG TPA: GlsB/YeaQ/YmgE family stress response membrane protein [Niabella sp.]